MCGGSDTPPPPDPWATSAAQYQFNSQAARDTAYLNAIDQYGPYGSTIYARRPDGTPYAQAVQLSPQVQDWLDSQYNASTMMQDAAARQMSFLPQDRFQLPTDPNAREIAARDFGSGALDYSKFADPLSGQMYQASRQELQQAPSTSDIAQTSYDQARSLFEGDVGDRRKAKEIELARRGIPIGSEIYQDEMRRMDSSENQLYNQASRQAILDAGQEQSRQFGQNLSSAQYGAGEDSRLQGADLNNRTFLGQQQNQQYNRLAQALGYGSGQYQTDLSNTLLERNQPYAEASAFLGSSPTFQSPSFMNTAGQQVAAPDYSGLVASNYQAQVAASKNQNNNGMWGAVGSVGSAVLPKLLFPSDEDLKEDRKEADGEMILASFRNMPVDDYRYKDEAQKVLNVPEHRTGTMAQDYAREFGGDGHTIDIPDAIGKLMAAVKALDERTVRNA